MQEANGEDKGIAIVVYKIVKKTKTKKHRFGFFYFFPHLHHNQNIPGNSDVFFFPIEKPNDSPGEGNSRACLNRASRSG